MVNISPFVLLIFIVVFYTGIVLAEDTDTAGIDEEVVSSVDRSNFNSEVEVRSRCNRKDSPHRNTKNDPTIAILVATTSHNSRSKTDLALTNMFLPTLAGSLDCGFKYVLVIGFDRNDPFYDTTRGRNEVHRVFDKIVKKRLSRSGIEISLIIVGLRNDEKRLHVNSLIYNALARYAAGHRHADYFYRVNDDTEFVERWPQQFVRSLNDLSAPYGVVVPQCEQVESDELMSIRNMTHVFVHKTHLEIFDMNFFPRELVGHWIDDWITRVYGRQRTLHMDEIRVVHHGDTGQRRPNGTNAVLVTELVLEGKQRILKWMESHNATDLQIQLFSGDQ